MAEMGCWGRGRHLALICVTKHHHGLRLAGEEGINSFFYFSLQLYCHSTITTQMIITTEMSCMERQPFIYSIVCFQNTTNIQSERGERAREARGFGGKKEGKGERGEGGVQDFRLHYHLSFVLDIKRAWNHHTLQ